MALPLVVNSRRSVGPTMPIDYLCAWLEPSGILTGSHPIRCPLTLHLLLSMSTMLATMASSDFAVNL